MEYKDSDDDNIETNIIQSLNLNYGEEKKEDNLNFGQKMNSLLNQLEVHLENVKKYANMKMPLDSMDINNLYPYNKAFNRIYNNNYNVNMNSNNTLINNNNSNSIPLVNSQNENEEIIEINNIQEMNSQDEDNTEMKLRQANNNSSKNLNDKKNNNYNKDDYKINEYQFGNSNANVGAIADVGSVKDSQNYYNLIQGKKNQEEEKKREVEEELKKKEEIIENKQKEQKNKEEELKLIMEEIRRREEELIQREKNLKDKENMERKIREEEEEEKKRKEEEKRKKKEEEEEAEVEAEDRLSKEYERLKKEEEEKEEEQRRENDRIKKERLIKEEKEKEEKERKRIEEEKKKELERKKKEEELQKEKELKEQIKKQKVDEEDEVKIVEVDDDEIEELEEEVSYTETSNFRSRIQQSITKTNIGNSNLNSVNNEIFKSQLANKKSINPGISTNSKINKIGDMKNKSINKLNNKSSINQSLNKSNNLNNRLKNKNMKDSNIKNSTNTNNLKKPKQQKQPETDISESKNINGSAQKFIKSSIYPKLCQEVKDKILGYINAVENFDTKNPVIDGLPSFPYINKFEKEEKPLSELVPNFEKNILKKYSDEQLDNKIKNFKEMYTPKERNKGNNKKNNKNDNKEDNAIDEYDKLLLEIAEIPNETHIDIIKKNFEKDKLKNLPKTSKEEANDLDELENKLFSDEKFLPEFNCPFSKLEDLQTFIYKYSTHESPKLMGNAYKSFDNWRMTLGDGNSFYRVNMFAIIENCILESNTELLSMILNEMTSDKFIAIYKKKKLKFEKPFLILSAILMMIDNNLEEKAYEFFLKAYTLKSKSFDLLLIIYLKIIIYNFAEEINKLLDEKLKSSVNSVNKEIIEKTKINLDEIDNLYIEPRLNIFYLMTFLFDININLFLVSGDFLNPKDNIKKIENEEESFPTFVFGHFFSSYHILYKPNYNNSIFKNNLYNDNPKITQLTFPLKDKKKCDICFKDTTHIVFLRKKFIVCAECLNAYIKNEIIKERYKQFINDKCFGIEYYSRPIHLQDDFYLDDYEFIEIYEDKNIINELYVNMSITKCLKCEQIEQIENDDSNLIKLKCGCTYCEDCFYEILKQITKGYGYLLECEYDMFKNNKFSCACKKVYIYNDLEEYFEKTDDELKEAKKRIDKYIKSRCMICFKDLIKADKLKKIKMRQDSRVEDHFMCEPCYNKYIKNAERVATEDGEEDGNENENENDEDTKDMAKENDSKEKKIQIRNKKIMDKDEQKIYCTICSQTHYYKGDGGSCACSIY